MRKSRKIISIMLVLCMTIGLTACGSKTEEKKQDTAANNKDYVYTMEELPVSLDQTDISEVHVVGDKIYALGYDYPYSDGGATPKLLETDKATGTLVTNEISAEVSTEASTEATEEVATTEPLPNDATTWTDDSTQVQDETAEEGSESLPGTLKVGIFDFSGASLGNFEIGLPVDSGSNGFTVDSEGNCYFVLDEYGKDTSNPESPMDLFHLVSYDATGKERFSTELGTEAKASTSYYYVNQIATTSKDLIILSSSVGLEIFDTTGKKITEIDLKEEEVNGNLITLRDDSVALLTFDDQGTKMRKLNMDEQKLEEGTDFPVASYAYNFYAGKTADILLSDTSGIYTYNVGDTEVTKIMDFIDSDVSINSISGLQQIDDKVIIGTYYDDSDGTTVCAKFTKVDPKDVQDKKVLTLGCNYIDNDVRKHVVEYNKTNDSYRIRISDYSSYNTDEDYMAGQNKLNTDIISGSMPDILILSTDMPIQSYISKGLLADFNQFIENDPDIKREDYMENVFDAVTVDGKMYQLIPSFYMFTVLGKTSIVGEQTGWTLDDLQALMKKQKEGTVAFNEMTQQDILNYSMWLCSNEFIDWNTGKCNFASESFIKLLEYAKTYPAEITYPEDADEQYWENYQTMYRNDQALLMPYTISNFEDYNNCEQGTFGEKMTPIGFPTDSKNGSGISFNLDFAISAKSDEQEAAWDFVRYYLTDEYQDNIAYGLPVKLTQIDKLAKKAQSRPFYLDEDGKKVEYDNTYNLNGVDVVVPPMTQEQTDTVIGYLKNLNQTMNYNSNVTDIITEETASFFAGQKTAKEVADIIQSRIQIYVNENR